MAHGASETVQWQKAIRLTICCLLLVCTAKAGHHKHPGPTPSPTPTPTSVTSPTPVPTPSPTASPTPSPTPVPTVTLAWDANAPTGNPATDAVGYHLKLGFASGKENTVINLAGQYSVWTVSLQSGTTYFFVVTAYNAAGVESVPSNEVNYTSPP